jgi:CubicO group peptidase (beta-lactamase class C family)
VFDGTLTIARDGGRWAAKLGFRGSIAKVEFESLHMEGDRVDLVFRDADDRQAVELVAWIRGDHLLGEMRWGDSISWMPVGGRRAHVARLEHHAASHSFPLHSLASHASPLTSAQRAALDTLVQHATESRSSALVIVRDGNIELELDREGYDGGPLAAMSVSKVFVSLAVGLAVAEGKLSLDTTVASLFPEWRDQGAKSAITVRHLLTHTSGLNPSRANWKTETIREHARNAKLVFPPGTRFQYNNGAVDLLGALVEQACGVPLDEYLETRVFRKLDIVGAQWMKDSKGTARGAGELFIRPIDLAKIGQMMLDEGRWQMTQIVPAKWILQSTAPGQPFNAEAGFLWWREGKFAFSLTDAVLAGWRDAGVDAASLRTARAIVGQRYLSVSAYAGALRTTVGASGSAQIAHAVQGPHHAAFHETIEVEPPGGFSARGWLGQFLVVLPKQHLVAVRMHAKEDGDASDESDTNGYTSFMEDVAKLN